MDVGTGITVTNFDWIICQLELEIKENKAVRSNAVFFRGELSRLKEKFPELVIDLKLQPTIGFVAMRQEPDSGASKWVETI